MINFWQYAFAAKQVLSLMWPSHSLTSVADTDVVDAFRMFVTPVREQVGEECDVKLKLISVERATTEQTKQSSSYAVTQIITWTITNPDSITMIMGT